MLRFGNFGWNNFGQIGIQVLVKIIKESNQLESGQKMLGFGNFGQKFGQICIPVSVKIDKDFTGALLHFLELQYW